ncbi:MAG TPA: PHP domain-containing protein [Acidimicrobiales bacterium]|nr:PHP domain-containing protein [Acidimicrobiales bacterium]
MRSPTSAAVARHPHLALPRSAPDALRVDCHVHTMWSGDSTTRPDELASAIEAAGLDVVCITDHSTVSGAQRLQGELDCLVVVGQEQRTPEGEIIGLFLAEAIPAGCRSATEAARAVRSQGGLVYIPHPTDPMRHRLAAGVLERLAGEGLVDVVEVRNAKTSLESLSDEAAMACVRIGAAAGGGSDAHVPEAIGAVYVEMTPFDGPAGFLRCLGEGRVVGHHFDPPRTWGARVVPSVRSLGRTPPE